MGICGSSIIFEQLVSPLDPLDVTELESRKTNRYDIEVEVPDGKYRKLENGYGQEEEKKETSSLKVFMKEDMNTPIPSLSPYSIGSTAMI